jgi:hypothetical protein
MPSYSLTLVDQDTGARICNAIVSEAGADVVMSEESSDGCSYTGYGPDHFELSIEAPDYVSRAIEGDASVGAMGAHCIYRDRAILTVELDHSGAPPVSCSYNTVWADVDACGARIENCSDGLAHELRCEPAVEGIRCKCLIDEEVALDFDVRDPLSYGDPVPGLEEYGDMQFCSIVEGVQHALDQCRLLVSDLPSEF